MANLTEWLDGRLVDSTGQTVLTDAECVSLLSGSTVGRLGFVHDGWPVVLPVNFVFDDPNLVIRTGPGIKLDDVPRNVVAFEVDGFDPDGRWGWSVLVQGPGAEITDLRDTCDAMLRRLPVRPFTPGLKSRWLKVAAARISGRAFGDFPREVALTSKQ